MALNFPASPSDGDTYENYVFDATAGVWKRLTPSGQLNNLDDVNITTPADGESLVYDSASGDWVNADATVEVYGVDTAATDYFAIPAGTDVQRPVSPANGYIRFNTESGEPEYYSEAESAWFLFREAAISSFSVEYLVVAGGGGGGSGYGGGGGAGGYRNSHASETSGRNSGTESVLNIDIGQSIGVTVGGGGAGYPSTGSAGANGVDSSFFGITSSGGGGGGGNPGDTSGKNGGSGGGGGDNGSPGLGTAAQGFDGGSGGRGGGGGASQSGGSSNNSVSTGFGGDGLTSSIDGVSTTRAGGGAGEGNSNGGAGGGAAAGGNGVSNTGGGGGGGFSGVGSGGSGVVIIKYPIDRSINVDPGLTSSTNVVTFAAGNFNVTEFTAGTGSVTFS